MRAEVTIANLRLNDGTVLELPERGVVLIVGPNNAGKSQFLRDVSKLISSPGEAGVVVVDASIQRIGAAEDFRATLQDDNSIIHAQSGEDSVGLGKRGQQSLTNVLAWWGSPGSGLSAQYFLLWVCCTDR